MNTDSLERLLREKIATEKPRPGFETRIQAMARESRSMEEHRSYRWLVGFGIAAVALVASLPKESKPVLPETVETTPPLEATQVALTEIKTETSVQKEIEGMKSDARRALYFLSNTVPSLIEK
ncbi:MAG: hypothetical protein QNL68_20620 [Akkermansiaceae bacterium]|jgi:hypothetical protein